MNAHRSVSGVDWLRSEARRGSPHAGRAAVTDLGRGDECKDVEAQPRLALVTLTVPRRASLTAVPSPSPSPTPASSTSAQARPSSLAEVYRDHADFVIRSTRHLGVPDAHVEDIVHDVFLVVHRRLADFDGRGTMRSWLYGITRRIVMDRQRSFARSRAREAKAPEPSAGPGPEEDVARRELAAHAQAAMAELDDDQRLVLVLADVEGLSAPEIAQAHGIKLNTVYSRLRLGRRKFERALAGRLGIGLETEGDGR